MSGETSEMTESIKTQNVFLFWITNSQFSSIYVSTYQTLFRTNYKKRKAKP